MRVIPTPLASKSTFFTLLAGSATLLVWNKDPFCIWAYEVAALAWAAWEFLKSDARMPAAFIPVAAIALWAPVQFFTASTIYPWATVNAGLENLALAGTAAAVFLGFESWRSQRMLLHAFRWFGVALAVVSVLAYWTSPSKILWIFPTEYRDNWGPFPSRNNFAQFTELCFPIAVYDMGRG